MNAVTTVKAFTCLDNVSGYPSDLIAARCRWQLITSGHDCSKSTRATSMVKTPRPGYERARVLITVKTYPNIREITGEYRLREITFK